MSRRARARAMQVYVWGAMSNTEPPDDDDGEGGMEALEEDGFDLDDGPDEYAADAAADRYQRDLDRVASQ